LIPKLTMLIGQSGELAVDPIPFDAMGHFGAVECAAETLDFGAELVVLAPQHDPMLTILLRAVQLLVEPVNVVVIFRLSEGEGLAKTFHFGAKFGVLAAHRVTTFDDLQPKFVNLVHGVLQLDSHTAMFGASGGEFVITLLELFAV
jgi:hypothetical protein